MVQINTDERYGYITAKAKLAGLHKEIDELERMCKKIMSDWDRSDNGFSEALCDRLMAKIAELRREVGDICHDVFGGNEDA